MLNDPLKLSALVPAKGLPKTISLGTDFFDRSETGKPAAGQFIYLIPYGLIAATTPLLVLANVMAMTTGPTSPQPFKAVLTPEVHKTLAGGRLTNVSTPALNSAQPTAQSNFWRQGNSCQIQ